DPGRVDELAIGEVDQDRITFRGDRLLERALQIRSGAEVELSAHDDDANSVVKLGGGRLEWSRIHAPMLPQGWGHGRVAVCARRPRVRIERRRGKLCSPQFDESDESVPGAWGLATRE